MAYTIILMLRDRTDRNPTSFNIGRYQLWAGVGSLLALPFVGFALGLWLFAPDYLGRHAEQLEHGFKTATSAVRQMEDQISSLEKENAQLRESLDIATKQRAEAEARIAFAETARVEATQQLQSFEQRLNEKEETLHFYEALVKPVSEQQPVQCFNIKAESKKGRMVYGVNLLRKDQSASGRMKLDVTFNVRAGKDVMALEKAKNTPQAEADHKVNTTLSKDRRLTGSFKINVPESGLRVLDIKAYNSAGKIVAQCWKAF